MQLGSLVLTGGQSRRMGKPKEFLPWRGSALLSHIVYSLLDCSYPVLVVARDAHQVLPPLPCECEVIYDQDSGAGPLAAIETGLLAMAGSCDCILVTTCDQPFLDRKAIAWMTKRLPDDAEGLVPEFDARAQPLCALYRPAILPALRELIAKGEKHARALAEIPGVVRLTEAEIKEFDHAGRFLRSHNTPEDFAESERQNAQGEESGKSSH